MRERIEDPYSDIVNQSPEERAEVVAMSHEEKKQIGRLKAHNAFVEYQEDVDKVIDYIDRAMEEKDEKKRAFLDDRALQYISLLSLKLADLAQIYAAMCGAEMEVHDIGMGGVPGSHKNPWEGKTSR